MGTEDFRDAYRLFANGDRLAGGQVVGAVYDQLCRCALRIAQDKYAAEDLVQEAIMLLCERCKDLEFTHPKALFAWLYKVARNKARRSWTVKMPVIPLPDGVLSAQNWINPVIVAAGKEELILVEEAINSLSPEHQEVLMLSCVAELDSQEIAKIVGIKAEGVRSRLRRARLGLLQSLSKKKTRA